MRHRLVKRSITFAGLHLLAFGAAFVLASPMLNVEREPSRLAVASSRVMLALLQPSLSLSRSAPVGELPMIFLNSLLWGIVLALTFRGVASLAGRTRRA